MKSTTNVPEEKLSPSAKSHDASSPSSEDFGYQFHSLSLSHENKGKFRNFYKAGHIMVKSTIGAIRKCLHITLKQVRAVEFISKKLIKETKPKTNYMELFDKLTQLDHPNIVKSYETFQDSKRYYIVME
jgi:serine/threonine protein kinase